ncbi:hypothetical protein [Microbispora sp. ATCC PTA-5024]|uniref:hypothetical protein n=1 Tax=Microbispora sp. ATCC PTA-5024 TaxID=316330 RepID=UPI0003DC7BB0|nr:hypothetical protein [Microbispora sp. ATCC PTA-5024]ETK34632.1 hypothetical protein MPTA5024_18330 [Microbispora sp. ATCC PTA-5024]
MAHPASTPAFGDFQQNLAYARQMVEGGRHLSNLGVRSFDTDDLYRAAWVQAVAALDHWVHEEIYHRAVVLAQSPDSGKPPRFRDFEIPMGLMEDVTSRRKTLDAAFRAHLRTSLGWRSFQNPDKIREAFALVSDVPLWNEVARVLNAERADGPRTTRQAVVEELAAIVRRRNKISHEADRDPDRPGRRSAISAEEIRHAIEYVEAVAAAILVALDGPPETQVPESESQPDPQEQDAEAVAQTPGELDHQMERYLQQLRATSGEDAAAAVVRLLDWWRARGGEMHFGRSEGSCAPIVRRDGRTLNMVRFYTKTVEIPFGALKSRRPFDKPAFREDLRQRLNEAPGVDIAPDKLELYPSFPITRLADQAVYDVIVTTMIWFADRVADPA